MRQRHNRALGWLRGHVPELLLALFVLGLAPLAALLARSVLSQIGMLVTDPGAYVAGLGADLWQLAVVIVCAAGAGVLAYLVLANWAPVWAGARKMILEGLNRRVVIVLLVFFAVLMPALPFMLKASGGPQGKVQMVLLYSLVLALMLLSLVAIFLATASLCSEVERKQVHITDTKPMPRWQFLMGKWFGIVVLCASALWLMGGASYALVRYISRPPDLDKLPMEEAQKAARDYRDLRYKVFVARKVHVAPLPDVEDEVEKEVQRVLEQNEGVGRLYALRQDIRADLQRKRLRVPSGGSKHWSFGGITPKPGGVLFLEFKAHTSDFGDILGQWAVARRETGEGEGEGTGQGARIIWTSQTSRWPGGGVHEVPIPSEVVPPDGRLDVLFANRHPRSEVIFSLDYPVRVLQRKEAFALNYYRSLTIVLIHVALLAALGLMAGSLFSFPVASLLAICLFVGGLIGPWFIEQFVVGSPMTEFTEFTFMLHQIWRGFAQGVVWLMPNFTSFSPMADLVNGQMVSLGKVLTAAAVLLFVKGGAAMMIACYFYSRRELAKTIV